MSAERHSFASGYLLCWRVQTGGFLEAAVSGAMSDYLARYGNILSGNYAIRRLVTDFTALITRTKSEVWLHLKYPWKCPFADSFGEFN